MAWRWPPTSRWRRWPRSRSRPLHVALDTRTVIGQAVGMLMERYNLEATAAFAVLKRVSMSANRKLRDVATELVIERELPEG
jgi:AmiR/NasT family two-component response regulator